MGGIYPNFLSNTSQGLYPDWLGVVLSEYSYVGTGVIYVYGTAVTEGPVSVPVNINAVFFGVLM